MSIRILLVDDSESWRRVVCSLVQKEPQFQIFCEVSDGLAAVHKADELKPDVILLDIGLPKLDGIKAARRIRQLSPGSKIIFLSQENSIEMVEAALGAGACGYVYKARAQKDLLHAIGVVLRDKHFVSGSLIPEDRIKILSIAPAQSTLPHLREENRSPDGTQQIGKTPTLLREETAPEF